MLDGMKRPDNLPTLVASAEDLGRGAVVLAIEN